MVRAKLLVPFGLNPGSYSIKLTEYYSSVDSGNESPFLLKEFKISVVAQTAGKTVITSAAPMCDQRFLVTTGSLSRASMLAPSFLMNMGLMLGAMVMVMTLTT